VLTVVTIYPELLSTYGDMGNALVLTERARRRGISAQSVVVALGDPLPAGQIYLLGGGEDGPQQRAADALRHDDSLARRVADGVVVVAVCAGLQLIGTSFAVAGNDTYAGLGLIEADSVRGTKRRVGDVLVRVGDQQVVGFENHGGVTTLHAGSPLGTVAVGFGNDGRVDGYRAKGVVATYAHGPVLALNPWLADEILAEATSETMAPLQTVADRLHEKRRARVAQSAGRAP
jgi:lipid II isoglutaminyl synthase (glutamine-hydrolysing)